MAKTDTAAIKSASAEPAGEAGEPRARVRQVPSGEPVAIEPASAPTPPERKFPTRPVLFALLPVALAIGAYVYVTGGATMSTDNAYVQADMVGVANDVAGIVSTIAVKENQQVAVGDVLFTLDQKPFQLALDRANAQLGSTRNDLLSAQANYRNMQAQIEQAQADIAYYDVTFRRQQELAKNNFTPLSSFDSARRDLQVAQQKLASLKQQLAGIDASLNGAPDAAVEDHPKYKDSSPRATRPRASSITRPCARRSPASPPKCRRCSRASTSPRRPARSPSSPPIICGCRRSRRRPS